MILSGNDIKKYIKEKNILENYDLDNIHSSSYDFSLANTIIKFQKTNSVISLANVEQINNLYEIKNIKEKGYHLKANECILISLKEIIHLPNHLCAHIRPRTSISRLGLYVNFQHINPGYKGTLSLPIYNFSPNTYHLTPGLKLGQIVFEELSNVSEDLLYFNEKTPVYYQENGLQGSKIYADFIGKVFRHYKGNYYFVEDISMNSETKEYMVVYKTLYHNKDSNLWVRPANMFFEEIDPNRPDNITGQKYRFELVSDLTKDFTKKEEKIDLEE